MNVTVASTFQLLEITPVEGERIAIESGWVDLSAEKRCFEMIRGSLLERG